MTSFKKRNFFFRAKGLNLLPTIFFLYRVYTQNLCCRLVEGTRMVFISSCCCDIENINFTFYAYKRCCNFYIFFFCFLFCVDLKMSYDVCILAFDIFFFDKMYPRMYIGFVILIFIFVLFGMTMQLIITSDKYYK